MDVPELGIKCAVLDLGRIPARIRLGAGLALQYYYSNWLRFSVGALQQEIEVPGTLGLGAGARADIGGSGAIDGNAIKL